MAHRYAYIWKLKDANFTKDKGKVFSCFACGGGSTRGYKLAGFDVVGCNEIDSRMMEAYIKNHHPKYSYLEGIQTFKERNDLPDELFNLDILDGSPPCQRLKMIHLLRMPMKGYSGNGLCSIVDMYIRIRYARLSRHARIA